MSRLDDGEEVVEVVRDAAGQHSQRFQLARAQQFLFHLLALSDFSPQPLGGLAQFGRPLLDAKLELLIQRFRLALAVWRSSTRSWFSNLRLATIDRAIESARSWPGSQP